MSEDEDERAPREGLVLETVYSVWRAAENDELGWHVTYMEYTLKLLPHDDAKDGPLSPMVGRTPGRGTRRRDASLHATMRCMLRSYLPLLLPVAAGATTFTVNDRGSAFASLHVKLQAGESMQAEPGALVKYSGDLRLGIRSSSSWLGRMFAGETPWTTSIRATSSPGECMLCPHSIGDIRILELASDEAICLSG